MISLHFSLAFVFLGTIGFFFRNRLRELEISLVGLIMQSLNKIYESVFEIFWNTASRVIKTLNKHVIDIISQHLRKMMRSENAVSSLYLKLFTKKGRDCFGQLQERRIWLTYIQLVSLPFLYYVIWSTPTNSACKESRVRQPGVSGFCDRASEFCA